MKTRFNLTKKLISILLVMALLFAYLPIATLAATPDAEYYNRVTDDNTMNNWVKYFDINEHGTANAGGVWTDKSVFKDADAFDGKVSMIEEGKNFLTALSTIAANKEIVGYSTVPTDTVLVLDLSRSISDQNAEDALIAAANDAIESLLKINKNNRVGVVLYSGSSSFTTTYENAVTRILEIDHYTTTTGTFLDISRNNNVTVNSGVRGSNPAANLSSSKSFTGYTYMQSGLWEAWKMFEAVPDITVGDNNWQSGDHRMPIVVLMTDGEPSQATTYYNDVENSQYTSYGRTVMGSNIGNGYGEIPIGQGFLVQLTASYIKSRIENKYQVKAEKGAGRSLFYTLGFEVDDMNVAQAILDPTNSTSTDEYWSTYSALTGNETMSVRVRGRTGSAYNTTTVNIAKDSYVKDKNYVDAYFSAESGQLENAFKSIVDEIIIQSRYYPTHLEGGSPDFAGYVEFTDTLGEYMEVKHINGILLGDTLFDGNMMASKLADTSAEGLGSIENPTELGDEFINAVKTRLGIENTVDAQLLVAKAFADGQLAYNGPNDWSNYIAWYAKADGSYAGFYDEDGTEPAPADAVFINRSYGFLGETDGSVKNSDMMYMSVQIHENIETGSQSVIWKVPAALVPMITYKVTLDGTNVDSATNVNVTVEEATPVRLIYETGLRADLNEYNITKITGENISTATVLTDERHIAADGHTRLFWNNKFNITGENHDTHQVALSEFTPNKENERFYYTFDSAVFKKVGNDYALVANGELQANGEYYHRRYNFVNYPAGTAAANRLPVFVYEKMSAASIAAAEWKDSFELLDHSQVGAYVVPKGTPARELNMYDEEKAVNKTSSANMVFHPYLSEHNNTVYVEMNLGNNGMLSVTPATGIKISKTVDIFEAGTSDIFKFRVTLDQSGSFDSYITAIGETPSGTPTVANFNGGVYEFELGRDQTLWLEGIPAGAVYTVEEISANDDYKVKSIHVNGAAQSTLARGTVSQYRIDNVEFVNTAIGQGDLVITKQVQDSNGNIVDVNDNIAFTAEVTLTNQRGEPVYGTFNTSRGSLDIGTNGKFTVTLHDGESFVVRGLSEETEYTVVETNIPNGFTLNAAASVLNGTVDASNNDQALIVNTYTPTETNGAGINVDVSKTILGRTVWQAGESYTFVVARIGSTGNEVGRITISDTDAIKTKNVSLANEHYNYAGTYYYSITELSGNQGGVTYDTAVREFAVVVADTDMDGDLEITAVNNIALTTVSGSWNVAAAFSNVYAPVGSDSVTLNIQKAINGGQSLAGYRFALYDANPFTATDYTELLRSALTNAAGETRFNLVFPAAMAGDTYTYYLAEVPGANPNITYTDKVYTVRVTVTDNGDGTVSAEAKVYDGAAEITAPEITFTNVYTPSTSDYVVFSGQKVISTNNRQVNANEFAFNIAADPATPAAPLPVQLTVRNSANGSFQFAPIEFTAAGEYKYIISEDKTKVIGGFTYDSSVYELTVTVTDSAAALTAEITRFVRVIGGNAAAVTDIVFENEYNPTPASFTISGTKLLTGKIMRGDEFSFKVEKVTADAPAVPGNQTVQNSANGSFTFGTIIFDKPGTFVYKVTEQDKGAAGYTYDKAEYLVTVTVNDNAEGALYSSYKITKNGQESEEIVFNNTFIPASYTYDIDTEFGIEKTLEGRPLNDGEFEFVLINAINGQQIGAPVKNDAQGKVDFPALTLHEVGTYHYKVAELVGDKNGVSYDNTVYHVVIALAQVDNKDDLTVDGQLTLVRKELHKATVVIKDVAGTPTEETVFENITGSGIEFINKYSPNPADIVLAGTKTLVGKELEENEFTFNLYSAKMKNGEWVKDQLIQQVKNDENGKFAFEGNVADSSAEYVFFITEDATNPKANVTYDTNEYRVVVTSTDNLDGTLTLDYEYFVGADAKGGVEFKNTYTEPTPTPTPDPDPTEPQPKPTRPDTGDSSNLALWFALLVISGAGFFGVTFLDKKKA